MAVCTYEKIIKYRVAACCTQPLHIGNAMGSKEEVLIHPIDRSEERRVGKECG